MATASLPNPPPRDRRWGPTPARVLVLQSMTSYPSASVLVNTPHRRIDAAVLAAVSAGIDEVERRLSDEGLAAPELGTSLRRLQGRLDSLPADRALGLFASQAHEDMVTLPVSVVDRVVIDPTFATRDLVRALHRTPRHLLLLLDSREARLFEVQGRLATPVHGSKFPLIWDEPVPRPAQLERQLRRVDEALGAYLRVHPAPLVIAAPQRTAAAFTAIARQVRRLAGVVPGNHLHTPLDQMSELTAPVVEQYLASRQAEALELLETREGQDKAVFGIDAVWLAARWERVEMLAVDQSYFYPARLSEDGDQLVAATDVDHPEVLDDAVDEVIEQVLDRRGWVAMVEHGTLPRGERIALTLR